MSKACRVCLSLILMGLGAYGVVHSAIALAAQSGHYAVRLGILGAHPHGKVDSGAILKLSDRFHSWYPYDYRLCVWIGEGAFYGWGGSPDTHDGPLLDVASVWCERGLSMNPHSRSLRLLRTRVLELEAPSDAAAYWEDFVEWDFWDPFNHAVLAGLAARAGGFVKALRSLEMTRNSPYYDDTRKDIRRAWKIELSRMPQVSPGKPEEPDRQ